jgi:hypothetical protein
MAWRKFCARQRSSVGLLAKALYQQRMPVLKHRSYKVRECS